MGFRRNLGCLCIKQLENRSKTKKMSFANFKHGALPQTPHSPCGRGSGWTLRLKSEPLPIGEIGFIKKKKNS